MTVLDAIDADVAAHLAGRQSFSLRALFIAEAIGAVYAGDSIEKFEAWEGEARGEDGKWESSGGGKEDSASGKDATEIVTKGDGYGIRADGTIVPDHMPGRDQPVERAAAVEKLGNALVAAGLDTEHAHEDPNHPGVYTAERQAQQREIVNEVLGRQIAAGAQKGNEAVMMGGLPGAGKTTATGDVFDAARFVNVNPDDFKQALADRGMAPKIEGVGPMEAAGLIHEESSTMAGMLADRAMGQGFNILHDVTMGSPGGVERRLDSLDANGYHTTGIFVDVPVSLSVQSVQDRYANRLETKPDEARFVPSHVIEESVDHSGQYMSTNRGVFESEKDRMGGWALFSRTGPSDMHLVDQSPGALDNLRAKTGK